jgi:D-glycero-alpha-D-manno-heptose-7-phosphate kinase
MIVVRAPLRISFVGGGTDLPDFYRKSPGAVISTTIDKFVYVVINRTPLIDKISARYSISETVDSPSDLQHTRIRAALLDLGIHKGIEIASFASLPAKTGIGSSSSFSVALMKGLHAYLGTNISARDAAEAASHLEIDLVREPIGKQDQYASAFGGFNVLHFNSDDSVRVDPVLLDYRKRLILEQHLLLFYTGITRSAGSVLTEQRKNIADNFETLQSMAAMVPQFRDSLLEGDCQTIGEMLHEGWMRKKRLASGVSNTVIDQLHEAAMKGGGWGGKILGAGGGGCLLVVASPDRRDQIRRAVWEVARTANLSDFKEIPFHFVQSGAETLYQNNDSAGGANHESLHHRVFAKN